MNRDNLIEAGIDYDEGLNRFAGMEDIYEKCLFKFFDQNLIPQLQECFNNKDYPKAFDIVHDLKGNSGNLSIMELYNVTCEMTEVLRGGNREEAEKILPQLKTLYEKAYLGVIPHKENK